MSQGSELQLVQDVEVPGSEERLLELERVVKRVVDILDQEERKKGGDGGGGRKGGRWRRRSFDEDDGG